VKAGQTKTATQGGQLGLLHQAASREMKADLRKKLVFPDVVQTSLRPDIVLWSEVSKKIIMIELTVPWADACEEAHDRKSAKYAKLADSCRQKGWSAWVLSVEVGARSFPAQSIWRIYH